MKDVFDFLGQLVETLVFLALFGGAGYLGWLSWGSKDVYLLAAAMGVLAVIGLLAILETTARVLGKMGRIERALSWRPAEQMIKQEPTPVAKLQPQTPSLWTTKPTTPIPNLNEAMDKLNKKKAEEEASKAATNSLREIVKEPGKIVNPPIVDKQPEKPTPAVAPDSPKPVEQPVKKYPFGRKPKEEPNPVAEAPKPDVETHGNGTHNESEPASISRICPKCGVADKMKKFGKHEGRQKWHCGNCGKTTVEPMKVSTAN